MNDVGHGNKSGSQRGIDDAYRTGRGSIRMRAVAEIVEGRSGSPWIVVTELPYQTSVEVIEVEQVPISYLPGNPTRLRVKAIGDLPI